MVDTSIALLRQNYHRLICRDILGQTRAGHFNNADGSSKWSVAMARGMAEGIGGPFCPVGDLPTGQGAGARFAAHTRWFLESSFALLAHLRPGTWTFSTSQGTAGITAYDQYRHLASLKKLAEDHPEVMDALGADYLIVPDIIVGKAPASDAEIESTGPVFGESASVATYSPYRSGNTPTPAATLHASVSCKWTIRSDRAQNTRTEALNLLRNRKGRTPYMVVVTAEPLSRRLASIAIGTGDIDCTYHAALYELVAAAEADPKLLGDQLAELRALVNGRRLRDISDLPFDLAL